MRAATQDMLHPDDAQRGGKVRRTPVRQSRPLQIRQSRPTAMEVELRQSPQFLSTLITSSTTPRLSPSTSAITQTFSPYLHPPLTPPLEDGELATSLFSKPISTMDVGAYDSICRNVEEKHFANEARVSFTWARILETVNEDNSKCRNELQTEAAASDRLVTRYMSFAVVSPAAWVPGSTTVNLILNNYTDAVGKDPSDYATWKPAVGSMMSWLVEKVRDGKDVVSQSTFGIITAGSRFLIVAFFPGNRRCYGEPDESEANINVRSIFNLADQAKLKALLMDVGTSEPPRIRDSGIASDGKFSWLPLEAGVDEDPAKMGTERRDSRSEMAKPALSATGSTSAG